MPKNSLKEYHQIVIVCSWCKKIQGYVESPKYRHHEMLETSTICDQCIETHYPEENQDNQVEMTKKND